MKKILVTSSVACLLVLTAHAETQNAGANHVHDHFHYKELSDMTVDQEAPPEIEAEERSEKWAQERAKGTVHGTVHQSMVLTAPGAPPTTYAELRQHAIEETEEEME